MIQEEKQLLLHNLQNDIGGESNYRFGRKMPFGKYKGWHVYWMILKHRFYAKWVNENTGFKFNETELWWLDRINEIGEEIRLNNLINALGMAVIRYGGMPENMENPHAIIE